MPIEIPRDIRLDDSDSLSAGFFFDFRRQDKSDKPKSERPLACGGAKIH